MSQAIKIHGLGSSGGGGEEIFVSFLSKLRDEKKFSSAEELKAQLNEDLRIMRNVTGD